MYFKMNYCLFFGVLFLKQILMENSSVDLSSRHKCSRKIVRSPLPKKCGYQKIKYKGKIVGGKEALLGDFPWLARIIYKNEDDVKQFVCGGFLIHPKYVLTAAHCISFDSNQSFGQIYEVELGEHNTDFPIDCNTQGCADPPQVIRVDATLVHPRYKPESNYSHDDIALIRLKEEANLTNFVQPICLLDRNIPLEGKLWVSGWGKTEQSIVSNRKLKVSVHQFSSTVCEKFFWMYLKIPLVKKQFCAGGVRDQDSCTGDSGGPLMYRPWKNRWYAVGIVSAGLGCGIEGIPGLYINVTSYLDWIYRNIPQNKL